MKKEELYFEESMNELDKIADELESGELSLEESVSKFEQGMNLSKQCSKILDSAEKKITMLINDENEIEEKDFKVEKE